MKYSDIALPAGWTIGPAYQASLHRLGKRYRLATVRDFTAPDGSVRTLPGRATAQAVEDIQRTLANYGEQPAALAGKPRTDREIVLQTEALARAVLGLLGYEAPKTTALRKSKNPRAALAWQIASLAQRHLTDTNPEDAVEATE